MNFQSNHFARLWVMLVVLFAANPVIADEIIHLKKQTTTIQNDSLVVSVLRDKTGKINAQNAYERYLAGDFLSNQVNPNYGYTQDAIWLALHLDRDIDAPSEWVLTIEPSTLDFLQLFQFTEPKGTFGSKKITGDAIPVKLRDYESHLPNFKIHLPENRSIILIRIQTTSQMTLVSKLTEAKTYKLRESSSMLLMGIYYGIQIAALIISYVAWRIVRNKEYLLFILHLFLLTLFWFTYDGFTGLYFLPDHPILANQLLGVFLCISYIISNIFIANILEVGKNHPISRAVLIAINLLIGVSAASIFTGHFLVFFPPLLTSMIVVYFVLGFHSLKHLVQEKVGLKIFAVSYLLYGAGNTYTIVMNLGFAPANDVSLHASQITYLIFILALHVGLHQKFKDYRLSAAKSELELDLLNKKLELDRQSNEEYKRLLHMIDHEIRTPVSIINSSVQSLIMLEESSQEKPERYKRYEKIHRSIKRLEMLMRISKTNASKSPEDDSLKIINPIHVVNEVIKYFSPINQNIHFQQIDKNIGLVEFDATHLDFVISNLIDNANKYSPAGSLIHIQATRTMLDEKDAIRLVFCNKTRHSTESYCNQIFEKYTRFDEQSGEPGLGMGLYLARDIMQSGGGSIAANCPSARSFCIEIIIPITHTET